MQEVKANTQVKVVVGPFVDKDDGLTPETGITLGAADEAELIKHDAASVTDISGNTWAAITNADGYYNLTLTAAQLSDEGMAVIVVQDDSVCLPVRKELMVLSEAAYDSKYAAKDTGYMDVNVKAISDDTTAADNAEADYDGAGYNKSNSTIGTCTTNTDMRGTDSAALASVCTEARLSELDAANIPADLDAVLTDTADMQPKLGTPAGASMSADIAAVKSDTADILADTADMQPRVAAIETDTDTTIPGLINGLNDLSAAQVNAEVDTALSDYDGPTKTEMDTAFTEIKGATYSQATDSLEAIRDRGDAAWVTGSGGDATEAKQDAIIAAIGTPPNLGSGADLSNNNTDIFNASGGATPALIADAVWDELLAGHSAAGSVGEALADIQTKAAAILTDTGTTLPSSISGVTTNVKDTLLNKSVSTRHANGKPKQYTAGTAGNQETVDTTIDADGNVETEVKQ